MSHFAPTQNQVRQGLDHVYYEIEQLNNLLEMQKISFKTLSNDPSLALTLDNAKFEAMLFHLRTLIDFFECPYSNRYKDDILSEDYGFPSRPTGVSDADKERINKELAHLTYSRPALDAPNRGWMPWTLIPPVLKRCKEFCAHIVGNFPAGNATVSKEAWLQLDQMI